VDPILKQIDSALIAYQVSGISSDVLTVSREDQKRLYALLGSTMDRLAPSGSFHREHFKRSKHGNNMRDRIISLAGMLRALRTEYENGYLQTVEELVHADMFSNFLDMADYLLEEKYKDAAGVIAGSAVEQHLRELCKKNGIDIRDANDRPIKAETLNQELRAKAVYNLLEQKNVTSWLDLRNNAAHGHYGEYDESQVKILITGVRAFIARHPA
jgi:hypothetical protein